MSWQTIVIFVLGIANFALNRAVFDGRHPLFARLPLASRKIGSAAALVTEFAVLFFALALVANGWPDFVWAYLGYSALNALAGWLLLARRV